MSAKTFPDGTTLKRYDIPSIDGLEGWASIVVGSDGFFAAITDFGDYAHLWPARGFAGDFRDMLCQFGGDYVLSKVSRKEYDGDATHRAIRKHIREERRAGRMTKEQGFEERFLLEEHEQLSSHDDFVLWYQETKIDDATYFACERWPVQAVAFAEKTLPRLQEMLRAEMAAEKEK